MRRIACWAMFIAALAAYRIGYADPPDPAAADGQPPEAQPKKWQDSAKRRKISEPAEIVRSAEELKIEQTLSNGARGM